MNVGWFFKRQILFQRLEVNMSQLMDLLRGPALGVIFYDHPAGRRHHHHCICGADCPNESLVPASALEHFRKAF